MQKRRNIRCYTNGGFADYISASEKNVFKIPDNIQWDVAASLGTTIKTPYHALRDASLRLNEFLVIFGASGNTDMMAVQFGKKWEQRSSQFLRITG